MSKIILKATNIELTDEMRSYIDKRIESLNKYLSDNEMVNVEVGKSTNHHKNGDVFRAEVRLTYQGKHMYTVSDKGDLFSAVDDAKEGMVRLITSRKERMMAQFRHGAQKVKNMMKYPWSKGK